VHICLVAVEIFGCGKYGGFGRATRIIGRELAKRGIAAAGRCTSVFSNRM